MVSLRSDTSHTKYELRFYTDQSGVAKVQMDLIEANIYHAVVQYPSKISKYAFVRLSELDNEFSEQEKSRTKSAS